MQSSDLHLAESRLVNVVLPSSTTEAALHLIRRSPSEEILIEKLSCPKAAPVALTAFSALQTDSERVFESVAGTIRRHPGLSWALVESLNKLPWFNGLRAFLSLPDDPLCSPFAYPFYILVRNKTFTTPDAAHARYEHYVRGLWDALHIAREGKWHRPHDSVVSLVELLREQLDKPDPDPFVVYFAALLLGRVGPLSQSIEALRCRLGRDCCPSVRAAAGLTLMRLGWPGDSNLAVAARVPRKCPPGMARLLAAFIATRRLGLA
jgi:hypothetical protein